MTKQLQLAERKNVEEAALRSAKEQFRKLADWVSRPNVIAEQTKMVRDLALSGADQAQAVVSMADNGSRIAHNVLQAIAREDVDTGRQRSATITSYFVKSTAPGWKFSGKSGPRSIDNAFLVGAIASIVDDIHSRFGLPLIGNPASPRDSASSIVSEALGVINERKAPKRIYNIWKEWAPIIRNRINELTFP